jgi:hypothetical protein
VDAGIDDVGPRSSEPGADPVEQGFAVGRENADPRRGALRIILDDDVGRRIADMRFGRGDLAGVGELPRRRFGQPVTVRKPASMGPGGARLPAELFGQGLLPLFDQRGAAMLLVAKPKPLLRRFEQGAQ